MILGHHINTVHGFTTVAEYANKTGAKVCQIFLSSPQTYKGTRKTRAELLELRKELAKYDIKIVVHGSFLINLCIPSDDVNYMSKFNNMLRTITNDLYDSILLGAIGVVIHMGHNTCNLSYEKAFDNYIKGIKEVLRKSDSRSTLILETGAGQGNEVATSLFELGKIRDKLTVEERKRVKFCLDTCHMFAAGYDLGNVKYVNVLEKFIGYHLGWDNIVLIHLNDSKDKLNCKKDRHADIGKGKIKTDGLKRFVEICSGHNIPLVLETPTETYSDIRYTNVDQMKFIKKWFHAEKS